MGDTQIKLFFLWLNLEKNTGYTMWEDGSGEEMTAKKGHQRAMSKKDTLFFSRKK